MTVTAVLVAAGRGERLGAGPKALVELGGRTLLEHAAAGLRAAGIDDLVVVHPAAAAREVAARVPGARLVPGGETRTASVRAGVAAGGGPVVAVHDAARALTPATVIAAAVAAVAGDVVAAAPGRRVADTLKRVAGDEVRATVDREGLVAIQTPQVFRREALERALAAGGDASDDLALVEGLLARGALTGRVVTVPGAASGLKITVPEDLAVAEALLAARERARR